MKIHFTFFAVSASIDISNATSQSQFLETVGEMSKNDLFTFSDQKKTSLKNIKTSNQLDYHSSCFGKTPSIICVRSRRNLTVVLITNKPYKAFLIYF
jgi:hypothetical protein